MEYADRAGFCCTGVDRRAPDPGLEVEFDPTPTHSDKPAEPYKPFQHSQHQKEQHHTLSCKKRAATQSGSALGKAARAKKAKAIERADKTNQKFVVNRAKAQRKKLIKS